MRRLKILFTMRNSLYLRNFESTIRLLASRGHAITILVSPDEHKTMPETTDLRQSLLDAFPQSIIFGTERGRTDRYEHYVNEIRSTRDFLRFRLPWFADAPRLAARVRRRASPLAQRTLDKAIFSNEEFNRRVNAWLAGLEAAVPPDPEIVDRLKALAPDIVLATPYVDLGADQVDWIKAARALGIPTALPVASWDNLTNKGIIQVVPDRVMVWNDIQRREAIELHGISADAVDVTGAQLFDQWFERRPSRSYETFCDELGFDSSKKTILYVGSTYFIARDETQFIKHWLNALRHEHGPALASANVLVRPHPMHQAPFRELDLSEFGRCSVYPRRGGLPVTEPAKADYFDALYYCSALVGINTSALVEASVLGKRCFSVRDPEFALTQEGTLHFHYLVNGGLLRMANGFSEHLDQLQAELTAEGGRAADIEAFVKQFIRPLGLDVAGTPRLADVIEATAAAETSAAPVARRTMAQFVGSPLSHCSYWSRLIWMKGLKRRLSRVLDWLQRVMTRAARRVMRYRPSELRRALSRVMTRTARRVMRYRPSELRRALSRVMTRTARQGMRYRPSELHRKLNTMRHGSAALEPQPPSTVAASLDDTRTTVDRENSRPSLVKAGASDGP